MTLDLFQARMLVGLADAARKVDPITASMQDVSRSRLALSGMPDVSERISTLISRGISMRDKRALMLAFWENYADGLSFYPTKARLLVNPPPNINPSALYVATLAQEKWPSSYGHQLPLGIRTIDGNISGYFDDVVLFSGYGINIADIMGHILAGTTLTVVSPSSQHQFWHGWLQADELDVAVAYVAGLFNVRALSTAKGEHVVIDIMGLEVLERSEKSS